MTKTQEIPERRMDKIGALCNMALVFHGQEIREKIDLRALDGSLERARAIGEFMAVKPDDMARDIGLLILKLTSKPMARPSLCEKAATFLKRFRAA